MGLVPVDSKFKSFIIQLLRKGTYKWKARTEAYKEARVSRGVYKCAQCLNQFTNKQIHLDHVQPVVDIKTGFIDWNTYIDRLFPPKEGWQVLCELCHDNKTKIENEMRQFFKKKKKKI